MSTCLPTGEPRLGDQSGKGTRGTIERAIAHLQSSYPGTYDNYCKPYEDSATRAGIEAFYRSVVEYGGGKGSTGCDLGCWIGLPCLIEVDAGAGYVFGVEPQKQFVDVAVQMGEAAGAGNVSFLHMREQTIPLKTESVDWVLINQVLCNSLPNSFEATIREAARILQHGGSLILCDSNNPYHIDVRERLATTYATAESPADDQGNQRGYNCRSRMNVIASLCPDLSAEELGQLADGTCYLWGDSLKQAAWDYVHNGRRPVSFFDPQSDQVPCNPLNGAALGNVTNPYAIARICEEAGFDITINVSLSQDGPEPRELHELLKTSGSFYVLGTKSCPK